MKRIYKYLLILFIEIFFVIPVDAATKSIDVNIDTKKISVNGIDYQNIKKYSQLDDFLIDYNKNNLPEIYLTSFLFDGVSSVKSPDLDDFIENGTNDSKIKTLEIDVLNINTNGNIELTGSAKGMMIAVNTNGIKGDINIILNGVNIDTDSKKVPAIYIYNRDITYDDCKVIIKTKSGTKNYIEGGKFKKVSLIPSDNLDDFKSYYSGNTLSNYEKYSAYYGIYSEDEIKNILFATVNADKEGLQDGDPYSFYKGSGAISSDIDLYFNGEGYLKVVSKNKEGIESKGNLIFSGGSGDYEILAKDDCLNTTTDNSVGKNVRNSLVIDVNSLVAIVLDDGDEGDAIDSNGTLTINGGRIYAFAHSTSNDSGLDSEDGIFINGGQVIATGNMTDMISEDSKQKYIYVKFISKIEKDTLIVIKDQDDKIIMAFKTNKDISSLFYSNDDLDFERFKIYAGGEIDGNEVNGLYTEINSYNNGEELSYSIVKTYNDIKNRDSNSFIFKLLLIEIISLLIIMIYVICNKYFIYKK